MNSTGDKIIDTILSNFREKVLSARKAGVYIDIEDIFETAVARTVYTFKRQKLDEKEVRRHIWTEEEAIRERCRKIVLELEKRDRLLDIRKTGVGSLLDEFAENSQYRISYKLRGNSTVGIKVTIPFTGQKLCFNTSFKKVLSDGWQDSVRKDIDEFMGLVDRLGRIRITNR